MEGPYREPTPLGEIIEPDRRRHRSIALVVVGMIAGVAVWETGGLVLEALAEEMADPPPPALEPPPMPFRAQHQPPPVVDPEPSPDLGTDTLAASDIQRVLAQHQAGIRRWCWDGIGVKPASADVRVNIIVGASGQVASASATGTDAVLASCVEAQVRAWQFPARSSRSGLVVIPFKFARE